MDNNQAHIDQITRDKLEQFQPTPPAHVWAGIEQDLIDEIPPIFIFRYGKLLIAAATLALIALSLWYVFPESDKKQVNEIEINDEIPQPEKEIINDSDNELKTQKILPETNIKNVNIVDIISTESIDNQKTIVDTKDASTVTASSNLTDNLPNQIETSERGEHQLDYLENRVFSSIQLTDNWSSFPGYGNESIVLLKNRKSISSESPPANEIEIGEFKNYWNIGLYFTPEMTLNSFDSLSFLSTYALNFEPSWYFNKNWFLRFGAGVSYVRDQGFAKLDYMSSEYMGSYDSVVDVTFEEVGGEVYPIYQTQEVDIWDSIRHLAISEVTNSYYYLQLPLMFGYHNSTDKFKWYFYGGPAVNISWDAINASEPPIVVNPPVKWFGRSIPPVFGLRQDRTTLA